MIGKPEWFTYRLFGWGIRPKTKEGYIYIGIFLAIILAISFMPIPESIRLWIIGALVLLLVIDSLHIMITMPKFHDERENYHQLIIERNVSFGAIATIIIIAFYQAYKNGFPQDIIPFDISLAYVLIGMVVVKILSTIYVRLKL